MDANCRPLEHFIWSFLLQDGQRAENKVFISPRAPPPFYSSSSFSCFVESKEKGLKIRRYPDEGGHRIPDLWHSKRRGGGHMTTRGIAHSHIFVLFVVIWYIIFCLYKTGPRKNNTTHHLIFICFDFFSYQNLGRRNYIFAQLLVTKCSIIILFFYTVGYETLTMSSSPLPLPHKRPTQHQQALLRKKFPTQSDC